MIKIKLLQGLWERHVADIWTDVTFQIYVICDAFRSAAVV